MDVGPFRIERYYARYEFTTRYMLSSSDCESRTIESLLELEPDAHAKLLSTWCGYTESPGAPELRAAIAGCYERISPDEVIVTSCAEEGIFLVYHALLRAGDHGIVETPCYESALELARSTGADVSPWDRRYEEGWVHDLDPSVERAWKLVSRGLPEIAFVDHGALFRNGLTILMVEASAYHRRWATEHPEKYGADVLEHIRRGFEIPDSTYRAAVDSTAELRAAARKAMAQVDALLLPATAVVAPPVTSGNEVREPLTRFTRPFNMTGQPVVALPAPVEGLPVGIQVVGRDNAGALAAAAWLEAEWRQQAS